MKLLFCLGTLNSQNKISIKLRKIEKKKEKKDIGLPTIFGNTS